MIKTYFISLERQSQREKKKKERDLPLNKLVKA